jgi:hypothetical protein
MRPSVPCQRVNQYFDVFGAVEPWTGVMHYFIPEKPAKPKSSRVGRPLKGEVRLPEPKDKGYKSRQMNDFMQSLSSKYSAEHLIIICDNAAWHKSQYMVIPPNVELVFIPKYTPEMNPIEQVWREIRTYFSNRCFPNLAAVKTHLESVIATIPKSTYMSITQRNWIMP